MGVIFRPAARLTPLLAAAALVLAACAPPGPAAGQGDQPAPSGAAATPGGTAAPPAQPYAGLQNRPIKALAPERVADLLAGRGAGYALAAELNHYPGPTHVLELAGDLGLTPAQQQAVQRIKEEMQRAARELGQRVVELEAELDQAFQAGNLDQAELDRLTAAIAAVEGRLRAVHLGAHLQVRPLLAPEQIAHYDQLRGYAAGGDGGGDHGGHGQHGGAGHGN